MNGTKLLVAWGLAVVTGCSGTELPLGDAPGGAGQGGSAGGSNNGGSSSGGSAGSGSVMPPGNRFDVCESPCFLQIVNATGTGCRVCHGSAIKLAGTLDLESLRISERLKDAPAEHPALPIGSICPTGDKLIDSANPQNSWLLAKIEGRQGACGTVMPPTGSLSATDQACMATYVNCVAGH